MPRFQYSFVRADGVVVRSVGEAESERVLVSRVQKENGYLLSVAPEYALRSRLARFTFQMGRSSLILALHEMGSLVRAGLPLDRAISVVAELFPEARLRSTLLRIRDSVRRGVTLADAMQGEPDFFTAFHHNLVRAGEVSASLDEALLRLAEDLRQKDTIRGKIMVALIYPIILLLVGITAMILLATVVLPGLAPIFVDAGQQMPMATRLILDGSDFLTRFWPGIILLSLMAYLASRQVLSQQVYRVRWDRLKLRLPLVGPLITAVQTAWFARTAGTLLKSGVALPTALVLARQTVTNLAMQEALQAAVLEVRGGRGLAEALQKSSIFSRLTSQLISVGEESGHLDDMLIHQAELFERSSVRRIESLVAIMVPVMTIAVGASVAGVLASILLAVMKLNELAS